MQAFYLQMVYKNAKLHCSNTRRFTTGFVKPMNRDAHRDSTLGGGREGRFDHLINYYDLRKKSQKTLINGMLNPLLHSQRFLHVGGCHKNITAYE